MANPLTTKLGIEHPILLAPMGDTAGGRLAAAVSDAGGFGLVGGGYADPRWLERELAVAGDARVGVGFITFALADRPDSLRLALDAGVPAVQLSFGDPRPHADAVHDAGAVLICQVQSSEEVQLALQAGADVLIAQGADAGGHGRGEMGTIGLVPSLVERVAPVPVVAAGGITEGRGLAAALSLGAAGVSMGTRFLASREALSTAAEAAALIAGRAEDTIRTPIFDLIRGPAWPTPYDGRALRNDLVERWHDNVAELLARRDALADEYRSTPDDDYRVRALWAGEGLDLITGIETAAEIVTATVRDARAALQSAARALPG